MTFRGLMAQSTNYTITIGPFVATGDGDTAQTGLTLAQSDFILSKNGGTWAQKAATGGGTHQASGIYSVVIGTGDNNTLGFLDVFCHSSAALYIKHTYQVVPANTYNALIGGTDTLHCDMLSANGAALTADVAQFGANVVNWKGAAAPANTGDAFSVVNHATYGNSPIFTQASGAHTRASGSYVEVTGGNLYIKSTGAYTEVTGGNVFLGATGSKTELTNGTYGLSFVFTKASGSYTELTSGTYGLSKNYTESSGAHLRASAAFTEITTRADVNTSSRLAATAAGVSNFPNIDVLVSSRLAGTATGIGNLAFLDVLTSSRLAATGGFSTFNPATQYVSAVQATATQVTDKTGFALTSAYDPSKTAYQASAGAQLSTDIAVVSASGQDVWMATLSAFSVDPATSGATAWKNNAILKAFNLSAATVASAVPAFIKRTPNA